VRKTYPLLAVMAVAWAKPAAASCPTTPDDPVCRPWSALLLPSVFGAVYAPRGVASTYVGAGAEAVLLAWSDNAPAFGPSQGRVRFDIGILDSIGSEPSFGTMVQYRLGSQVSFERNASRSYMIPVFAFDLGGLYTASTRTRWFADAGVGLYLLQLRSVVIDLEATYVLPFKEPDVLAGMRTRLGVSVALW
jgi:hypothetical protein